MGPGMFWRLMLAVVEVQAEQEEGLAGSTSSRERRSLALQGVEQEVPPQVVQIRSGKRFWQRALRSID